METWVEEATELDDRASVMVNRGDYAGALPLRQQALELLQTARAAMSPIASSPMTLAVVGALCDAGKLKQHLGDLPGAQTLWEQAVALAEQPPLGPHHPLLANTLRGLGLVLCRRGRYDEADASLQRALTMQEQLLGPDHEDVSETLTVMGESCIAQGNYRRAKGLLKRAVAIAELHVVPDQYSDRLFGALHSLFWVNVRLEDYALAQPIAERQRALCEQFLGPHHRDTVASLGNVAACLKGQSKFSEAQALYERVLADCERIHGPNHTEVATILADMAGVHCQLGDPRQAKSMLERALAIHEQVLGPQHLQVAHTVNNLAGCHVRLRDLTQAKALFERALAIYETQLGRTHPDTASILSALADLAAVTGRPRHATDLAKRAATAAVAATHQPCGWCGHMDVHQAKKCGQCKAVWYCNEECQRKAWKEHKTHCHAKPAAPKDTPKNAASAANCK
jgi:tetratricopeptide (TPR) repeat protein